MFPHPSLPMLCFYGVLALLIVSSSMSLQCYVAANATSDGPRNGDDLLSENAITASISRKLAFPDFRDDEKAGAITLLGSAEIDKSSGTINIPAISKQKSTSMHNLSMTMPPISRSHLNNKNVQAAPSNWSSMAGRALYSFPFRMMDPISNTTASFHTSFSFRMQKASEFKANSTINSSHGGLTFLIVPDELTVGRNIGMLGTMNDACNTDYKPFSIEFDTFKNQGFHDPNHHHVGINYGNVLSRWTANVNDAGVFLQKGDTVRAWISYDSYKHLVDVRLAKDGSDKPVQPLLAVPLDLSHIFKEYMFVGFSAAAQGNSRHSILSWHFSSDSIGILRMPKQQSCMESLLPTRRNGSSKPPNAFIIFCLVVLVLALAFLNFVCIPYNKLGREEVPTAVRLMKLVREKPRALLKPRKFSLNEILEASRLFNEGEILGNGPCGTYYRGVLHDSSQVAIKRFSSSYLRQVYQMNSDRKKVEKDINRLAQVHHPNIVSLRGWSIEKEEALLVYEYMPNGSLDQWIFSQTSTLPWIRRYKIVKEIAGALAFLHSSLDKPIVHKNLKLSNILLDITFRAKLGDYGIFCKAHPMDYTVKGKYGLVKHVASPGKRTWHALNKYICPPGIARASSKRIDDAKIEHVNSNNRNIEWAGSSLRRETSDFMLKGCMLPTMISESLKREGNDAKLTEETDVYAYGVILFEIVSGKMHGEEEEDLVKWIWSLQEEGRLMDAIDEDLRIGASRYYTWEEEAACVLTIGMLCTARDPSLRPSMETVTKYLNGEIPIAKVPSARKIETSASSSSSTHTTDEHDTDDSTVTCTNLGDGNVKHPASKFFSIGRSPIDFYRLKTSCHNATP
ncbi:hypothetical protein KP509_01G015300 [Ceratopteris richardii]|nr:hypothetical protein KP509_01G015300 [Ceratopteris richardii]